MRYFVTATHGTLGPLSSDILTAAPRNSAISARVRLRNVHLSVGESLFQSAHNGEFFQPSELSVLILGEPPTKWARLVATIASAQPVVGELVFT